jgi:hypothetical protein
MATDRLDSVTNGGTMISADDHENMALTEVQRDEHQAALISAVLALASAVNRLAEAHESVAIAIGDLTPPRSGPRGR